jgi:RNA polymerase Rpb1, domain 5
MGESWADIVRGYGGGRAWADVVDEDEASSDADIQHPTSDWMSERFSDVHECGDPVGIRAIQSILMSATQMNLSHFHTAGMDGVAHTASAPTAAEAMNASYANVSMTFESDEDVRSLRKHLVGADLKSFVVTVGGSFTVLPDHENVWYEAQGLQMSEGTVIRFYINYMKMIDHGLTLTDLARESFGDDVVTHVSPDFMGMIDVEVPNEHLSQWLSRMGQRVCGTPSVKSCDKLNDARAVTNGTDVMAVSRIGSVRGNTITSNNAAEVEVRYGIEAAAGVMRELTGSAVVSDFMTRTGRLLPFTKNSAEVRSKGLLSSMGFERPKEDIKKAIAGRGDFGTTSVYESIITGSDQNSIFDVRV